ncbi:MAG: hypothetical protein LH468_12670 [Nocardioides sp.]|nr:hypothetical protein [Nocardioides sp.]
MTPSSSRRPSARVSAIVLGVLLLVAMAGFAIGLPRLAQDEASSGVSLPDTLPGGWTAIERAGGPDGADDAEFTAQQAQAVTYVNEVLGGVYDEPTGFQAYVNDARDSLVTVTVFDAAGGAFAPANGVADPALFGLDRAPVELTREGDAVCIANYQSAAQSGQAPQGDPDQPLSVSCQTTQGAQTVQLGSQGMSVGDTVELLDRVGAGAA